jgi:hypothetical protein
MTASKTVRVMRNLLYTLQEERRYHQDRMYVLDDEIERLEAELHPHASEPAPPLTLTPGDAGPQARPQKHDSN